MFYYDELRALKRVDIFRERENFDDNLVDFASNDYLGLSRHKRNFNLTCKMVSKFEYHSPKASMLVNGYSAVHKEFEEKLYKINGFEAGVIVGSGYLANIALIEALVRRKDTLFIDEDFHSSGVLASRLLNSRVVSFKHNDPEDLRDKLSRDSSRNRIVLVEGIYSMSGDTLNRDIFDVADEFNSILIVDEAHSSGVVGERLLGVYEHYNIKIKPNHIKMGTLGKAYASYGAYILASEHIILYLINRAKPIIYSTALSLFDTALAMVNFEFILKHHIVLNSRLQLRRYSMSNFFGHRGKSLILNIEFKKDKEVKLIQRKLIERGFIVGAIRRPTVKRPILRVIPNIGVDDERFEEFIKIYRELDVDDKV